MLGAETLYSIPVGMETVKGGGLDTGFPYNSNIKRRGILGIPIRGHFYSVRAPAFV